MKEFAPRRQAAKTKMALKFFASLRLCAKPLLLVALAACSQADPIRDDEEVVLFPTYAIQDPSDGSWTMPVHGWIFEPRQESSLRHQFLTRVIEGSVPLSELQGKIFSRRASLFLADNERGKRIKVLLAGQSRLISESGENGHFRGEIRLSNQAFLKLADQKGVPSLSIQTAPASDGRVFRGRVFFAGQQGLSVISDIDDTIKVSDVLERRKLVANTFLHPFRAVDGMTALYKRWADQGASFHYVSSSPWQLFPELADFMAKQGFPPGSFHLKTFRVLDSSFFDLFKPGDETKPEAIGPILEDFPQRTFILVGDSGEQDPEVYGELLRLHPPQRIRHAYIRNVTGQSSDDPRLQQAFRQVDPSRWTLFTDPSQIQ